MYAPAQHDEVTGLVNYIDQQLTAIRAAAFGLTEEQARETPCRSALSVGGIIKHAVYIMRGALERLRTDVTEQPVDAAAYAGSPTASPCATTRLWPRPSRTSTGCGPSTGHGRRDRSGR